MNYSAYDFATRAITTSAIAWRDDSEDGKEHRYGIQQDSKTMYEGEKKPPIQR